MDPKRSRTFRVVRPLSIRTDPTLNAARVGDGLLPPQTVQADGDSRTEADGFVWWRHEQGWSAERSTDGSNVFLEAVDVATDEPQEPALAADEPETPPVVAPVGVRQVPPLESAPSVPAQPPSSSTPATSGKRRFTVVQILSIRDAPSLSGNRLPDIYLNPGDVIEVISDVATEADGFVWWQHNRGWSAERKVDGSMIYLQMLADAVEEAAETVKDAVSEAVSEVISEHADEIAEKVADKLDEGQLEVTDDEALPVATKETQTFRAVRRFRVLRILSVRSEPGLGGERLPAPLGIGTVIDVDEDSRCEVDGYVWWRHAGGWSAESKLDGSVMFLGDPEAAVANAGTVIDPLGLPQRDGLFQRLPVELSQVAWVQYFGNTWFAYENGARWNYPRFAQGLHSGLDFGNGVGGSAPAVIPVVAGVTGTFLRNDQYGVAVRSGEYVVIYLHLINTESCVPGQPVNPNTPIGIMDPSMGSNRHLHLEVRYGQEKWIVNPLLLMPAEMRNSILGRWANYSSHFCNARGFSQWQLPLEQPVIQLGGPLIGPTA